jgi:hypothetical protein
MFYLLKCNVFVLKVSNLLRRQEARGDPNVVKGLQMLAVLVVRLAAGDR